MNMDAKVLQKSGLTEGESKVYLSLLGLGQSSITKIVTKSKVSTSKSYDILNRLEEKGLVSHALISGIKHFKAASPNRIIENLESKEKEMKTTLLEVEKILPFLLDKQKEKESDEEAEIYIGMNGLISVFNEETAWMKETNGKSYAIGLTTGGKYGESVNKFFERMQYKRDKLKLKTYIIANKKTKGSFHYLEKSKHCQIKYVEAGSEMVSINTYSEKTIIAIYSKKPFLFVIKSKDLAKDFKEYFDSIWKQ